MQRCVIIGAAPINNYDKIKAFFKPDDFFIFCDAGLKHQPKLKIIPNLIIGDFDSIEKPVSETETIVLPSKKDDTDVFYAVKEAIKRGFNDFLLTGVIGERFDHSLCNLSVLLYLEMSYKKAKIIDDYSVMQIVSGKNNYVEDDCQFFSLMCINGDAEGVTIKNAEYEIENETIKSSYQFGISNKVLKNSRTEITIDKGKMLLMKIF
jgi:thiamine pyrophosphokinase